MKLKIIERIKNKFVDEYTASPAKEAFAKYMIRTGHGNGLMNHVTDIPRDMLEGTVYLFAIKGLIGISLSPTLIPIIVISKKIVEYFLGFVNEKIGFLKTQNDITSRELNPFNKELLDRIKGIEKNLKGRKL